MRRSRSRDGPSSWSRDDLYGPGPRRQAAYSTSRARPVLVLVRFDERRHFSQDDPSYDTLNSRRNLHVGEVSDQVSVTSHGTYKLILSKFSLLDLSGDAFDIGPLFSIRELSKHIWYNSGTTVNAMDWFR